MKSDSYVNKVDRPNSVHPLIRSTPHLRPPPGAARPAPCNGRGGIARSHSWRTCRRDINGRERGPGAEADLRSGGVLFWALQIIPSRTKVAHGFVTSRSYRNGRGGINRRVIPTHAVEAARPLRAGWGRKRLLHGEKIHRRVAAAPPPLCPHLPPLHDSPRQITSERRYCRVQGIDMAQKHDCAGWRRGPHKEALRP